LDTWDENFARDAAESELVDLFVASFGISGNNKDDSLQSQSSDLPSTARLLMGGSETAANAMITFIEMASFEKSRLQEMASMYLPTLSDSAGNATWNLSRKERRQRGESVGTRDHRRKPSHGNESTSSASDGDNVSADLKKAESPSKTETSSALEEHHEFTQKIDPTTVQESEQRTKPELNAQCGSERESQQERSPRTVSDQSIKSKPCS
jgi:hypothetical protein